MARYGRPRDALKVMPGIMVHVGETVAEAEAKVQFLADKLHPAVGLQMLSEFLEADLSDVPLDKPFPRERLPETPKGSKALFEVLREFVMQGHTVGELIRLYAEKQTGNGIKGTLCADCRLHGRVVRGRRRGWLHPPDAHVARRPRGFRAARGTGIAKARVVPARV